jgi:hydrogenase maturation protease
MKKIPLVAKREYLQVIRKPTFWIATLFFPDSYEDEFPSNDRLDFAFYLQLTPELAEQIAAYARVCFVDAHTGSIAGKVQLLPVEGQFQHSPFTHHLTAQSLLSMCQSLYGKTPQAALLSVRGYQFEFERQLSAETAALVPEALERLLGWLETK